MTVPLNRPDGPLEQARRPVTKPPVFRLTPALVEAMASMQGRPGVYQALRLLRPRARRAAMTLRPPLVAMRERNPWRRLRTSLLGW
jgi:hypothetical protein